MDRRIHPGAPWHQRQAQHEHYRRFEHLLDLHQLTETWIQELVKVGAERPAHSMDRGVSPEITQNLWMLGSLAGAGLDALLDDTNPDDVLGRLERTAWSVQAYTLSRLLDSAKTPERAILNSLLEQSSWKLGRGVAERKWAGLDADARSNMRTAILTLADTVFVPNFLTIRATEEEARIELLRCPHQSQFSEVQNTADALCSIHGHWIRGFAYGLHPQIAVQCSRTDGRCRQIWSFHSPQSSGEELPN